MRRNHEFLGIKLMSRPLGLRQRKDLYEKILALLKKKENREGLVAWEIGQAIKENDATTRLYLKDMVKSGRLITVPNPYRKNSVRYRIPTRKPRL